MFNNVEELINSGHRINYYFAISAVTREVQSNENMSFIQFTLPLQGLLDFHQTQVEKSADCNKYQVIGKTIRTLSCWERIGRIALGIILTLCTMFMGLFSSDIRGLFSNSQETYVALYLE